DWRSGLQRRVFPSSFHSVFRVSERTLDTAQFGKSLQAADGRISRLGAAGKVVEDFLAVVGTYGDFVIRPALGAAALFFPEKFSDDRHHVGMAFQVFILVEGTGDALLFPMDVAQMGEMDARGKPLRHG